MEWYWALILLVGLLLVLMGLGLPVAFGFFGVNIVGGMLFLNGTAGIVQLVRSAVETVSSFTLSPIPFFILMGEVLFHSGLAFRAIDAVDRLFVRVPGRLSLVAVSGGTIFAALSGSSMANTAMMGSVLLPEMRKRGYHHSMSMGPILGTGGIAILIPPSALAVMLGSLSQIPITDLLLGGILPGLLMALLFIVFIVWRCLMRPDLAPYYALEPEPLKARIKPFLIYVVPLLLLFVIVVGSIMGGIATPTESAALGAVGAILATILYRCFSLPTMKKAVLETTKVTVMAFFIICASATFSQILAFSSAVDGLLEIIKAWQLSPFVVLIAMMAILLVLGMLIDQLSMMLITLPFFIPMAQLAGFDMVWFGVLMLIVLEISFTTPPFGLLLFVMKGVAPPDVTMRDIIAAVTPFIGLEILTMVLVGVLPFLATWLPSLAR